MHSEACMALKCLTQVLFRQVLWEFVLDLAPGCVLRAHRLFILSTHTDPRPCRMLCDRSLHTEPLSACLVWSKRQRAWSLPVSPQSCAAQAHSPLLQDAAGHGNLAARDKPGGRVCLTLSCPNFPVTLDRSSLTEVGLSLP